MLAAHAFVAITTFSAVTEPSGVRKAGGDSPVKFHDRSVFKDGDAHLQSHSPQASCQGRGLDQCGVGYEDSAECWPTRREATWFESTL